MADDSVKKLLIKLGISTKDWQTEVEKIKKKLKEIQEQSLKDSQERQKSQKVEIQNVQLQIAEQKRLRAEAEAMAAVDKAKAAWRSKQTEEMRQELLVAQKATVEQKKQADAQLQASKLAQEQLRTEDLRLKLAQRQTQEQVKQRKEAEVAPAEANVAGIRAKVQGAFSAERISAIQREVVEKQIADERAKLATMEAQLRILSQQEGVRKVDVDVVTRELGQERAKLSLLESQLRIRVQQEKEAAAEARRKAGLPTATGVATLRTATTSAAEVKLTKEQTVVLEKQIAEEKAKLSVQQAQLRELKLQGDFRKADVAVLEKEIAAERSRLAVQEAQVRAARLTMAKPGGEGGGGFLGGALMSLSGGIFGGGLPGMLMAGVAAGTLLERVLEKLGEQFRDVAHEISGATGEAARLQEQFNKLAQREGQDPTALIMKLTKATRGLVDDNELMRVANNFMAGSLRITSDEMVKLTSMTVALARATGRDATQAIQALVRASLTGRTMMLAMVTGIDRTTLAVQGLGQAVDPVARKQLELHTIMSAMAKRLAEVGTPMTTLRDLFTQVNVVQESFVEEMAYSLGHSQSFAKAVQTVSQWILDATPKIWNFGATVGNKLGNAFAVVEPLIVQFWHALQSVWGVASSLIDVLGRLGDAIAKVGGAADSSGKKISGWSVLLYPLQVALGGVTLGLTQVANAIELVIGLFDALKNRSLKDAQTAMQKFAEDSKNAVKDFKEAFKLHKTPATEGQVTGGTAGSPPPRDIAPDIIKARRKTALDIAQEEAKIRLDARLAELEEEETAEKRKYDIGLQTLSQYLQKEKQLRGLEHQARLKQIEDEKNAQMAALQLEAAGQMDPMTGKMTAGMDPVQLAQKQRLIVLQSQEKTAQENRRAKKEETDLDNQFIDDQIAARKAYVEGINKIEQEGVQERAKLLEDEFKSGEVSANQYLDFRKQLIQKEYLLRVEALNQEAEANKQNAAALAKIRIDLIEATIKKEHELLDLEDKESQIRLEAVQRRYQMATELANIDVTVGTARGNRGQVLTGLEAQQDITTRYLQQLQSQRDALEATGDKFTDDWVKVNVEIGKAIEQQARLNQQIAQARDWAGPLGKMFGQIASDLSGVLGTGTANVLQQVSRSFESLSAALKQRAAQRAGQEQGVWSSIKDLFRPVAVSTERAKSAMEIFQDGLKNSAQKVQDFITGLGGQADKFAQTVETSSYSFMSSIGSTANQLTMLAQAAADAAAKLAGIQSLQAPQAPEQPPSATVEGGQAPQVPLELIPNQVPDQLPEVISATQEKLSGFGDALQTVTSQKVAGFSEKLGGVIEKITAFVSSAAQTYGSIMGAKTTAGGIISGGLSGAQTGMMIGGPIGAAIGGAFGAVFGGIMGHKAAKAQKEADEIKARLDSIRDVFSSGGMTLGAAIQQLQTSVGPMIGRMSRGSKAEQKQAAQLQQQYVQELQQLLAQQKQLMDQLVQELGVLMEPQSYQGIMQSLEQIIAKYKEFASAAAGDTQKVAMATQWLQLSLQQYATTLQSQVNDANEQAIQDALHLNDLLKQRQDILNSAAQQEYDIMTQGVMARQMTGAQSKMQQMAAVEYQKNTQLQQIDEETKLTQYKVESESKIFGLAQSRVGLEQQLLALQEQSTDKQMAEIQAMMQTIAKLDAALAGGGLPQQLLNALGGVDVNALADLLGLPEPGVGPGGQGKPYITNAPPLFEQMIAVMTKVPGYTDFQQQLIAAAQTPFGSQARLAIQKEIDFYGHGPFGHPLMDAGLINPELARNDPNWLGFYNWILSGMEGNNMAGYKAGGEVKEETALAHKGEWVVPEPAVKPIRGFLKWVTNNPTSLKGTSLQGGSWMTPPVDDGGPVGPPEHKKWEKKTPRTDSWWARHYGVGGPKGGGPLPPEELAATTQGLVAAKLNGESQVYSLASARVSMEMDLIDKQSRFAALEVARLDATRKLYETMKNGGIGVVSLEGAFAKLYELRGRYGSAGFAGEQL